MSYDDSIWSFRSDHKANSELSNRSKTLRSLSNNFFSELKPLKSSVKRPTTIHVHGRDDLNLLAIKPKQKPRVSSASAGGEGELIPVSNAVTTINSTEGRQILQRVCVNTLSAKKQHLKSNTRSPNSKRNGAITIDLINDSLIDSDPDSDAAKASWMKGDILQDDDRGSAAEVETGIVMTSTNGSQTEYDVSDQGRDRMGDETDQESGETKTELSVQNIDSPNPISLLLDTCSAREGSARRFYETEDVMSKDEHDLGEINLKHPKVANENNETNTNTCVIEFQTVTDDKATVCHAKTSRKVKAVRRSKTIDNSELIILKRANERKTKRGNDILINTAGEIESVGEGISVEDSGNYATNIADGESISLNEIGDSDEELEPLIAAKSSASSSSFNSGNNSTMNTTAESIVEDRFDHRKSLFLNVENILNAPEEREEYGTNTFTEVNEFPKKDLLQSDCKIGEMIKHKDFEKEIQNTENSTYIPITGGEPHSNDGKNSRGEYELVTSSSSSNNHTAVSTKVSLADLCQKTTLARNRYRVGLSKRRRIEPLHEYLHK